MGQHAMAAVSKAAVQVNPPGQSAVVVGQFALLVHSFVQRGFRLLPPGLIRRQSWLAQDCDLGSREAVVMVRGSAGRS
jgi:hypothetical protein